MSTNTELEKIARGHGIYLKGIFLNNEIGNLKAAPGFYIFNLDRKKTNGDSGTHWVCAYCLPGLALYCDSFGQPPTMEVENWLNTGFHMFKYTNRQVQDLDSDQCGLFCLSFGAAIQHAEPPGKWFSTKLAELAYEKWIGSFFSDLKKNDSVVINLFKT